MRRITSSIVMITATLFLCLMASCADPGNIQDDQLTEEEALEIVEAYIIPADGGAMADVESITSETENITLADLCDTTYLDTFIYSFVRPNRQATSEIIWNMSVLCNNFNIPQSASVSVQTSVDVNTPRIISTGNSTFAGTVTGLELRSPSMSWSGNYIRSGNSDLTFRNANDTDTELDLSLTNVVIDKRDQTILSGTGVYTLDVLINGNSQNFQGTIAFNGNQTATIVVNGTPFTVDLRP
ncbi:MAG: hypothetical protein MRZ79_02780 [Bacteroidia bacterium]|nr:hypothetical protein [Bacteroidia bacterium]